MNFTAELFVATANMLSSSLFFTGGDELNIPCYTADPETQQILSSTGQTLEETLNTFVQVTHGALEKLGKTRVVSEGKYTPAARLTYAHDLVSETWCSNITLH